jgi:hypothetical protein
MDQSSFRRPRGFPFRSQGGSSAKRMFKPDMHVKKYASRLRSRLSIGMTHGVRLAAEIPISIGMTHKVVIPTHVGI